MRCIQLAQAHRCRNSFSKAAVPKCQPLQVLNSHPFDIVTQLVVNQSFPHTPSCISSMIWYSQLENSGKRFRFYWCTPKDRNEKPSEQGDIMRCTKVPSRKMCPHMDGAPPHIHTSELGWNSFLSVAQPGSLYEVSARPKNLWTSQARNLSRLCLIIKMCSISNTSPLHAGCRRGRKCLGSSSWPGLSSDWLLSWSCPGVLSLGRRRSLHPRSFKRFESHVGCPNQEMLT